jgi:hypothetical protein
MNECVTRPETINIDCSTGARGDNGIAKTRECSRGISVSYYYEIFMVRNRDLYLAHPSSIHAPGNWHGNS